MTPHIFQQIDFELVPDEVQLEEIVILPGENPAEILLRKVIENKETNNRQEFDAYEYEVYTKLQFDANNITIRVGDVRKLRQKH